MSSVPRRTIEELEFIYRQDPDRRDIFVEGSFDAGVVNWLLNLRGDNSVAVYEIDTIHIPDGDIIATGRNTNNRERVIFLAEQFSRIFSDQEKHITCLVDADFGYLTNDFVHNDLLLYTDYACMEMYFFKREVIGKFFTIYCNKPDWPTSRILTELANVLQEFFLCRFANEELKWELDWLDKVVCIKESDWKLSLDLDEFVLRLLNKNARAKQHSEFLAKVDELRSRLQKDPRFQINGHDFISIIIWLVRQKGMSGDRFRPENIKRTIVLSDDFKKLQNENMFKKLIQRLDNSGQSTEV